MTNLESFPGQAFALTHVSVFDGERVRYNQAIIIDGETIVNVVPMTANTALPTQRIPANGLLATAGFIDIQLNGCGGVLFNTDIGEKALDIMNATNLKYGTTQFLPTLITSDVDDMTNVIELVEGMENRLAKGILGLHLEGPFISKDKKGAHQAHFIRDLDLATAQYLAKHSDRVKVVTLAPECVDQAAIDCLVAAGITVSLGHTNATYQQLAEKQGMTMATHLYNAMTPLGSRESGAVGYIFDHQPTAGIIVDGIHSSFASVRIAHNIMKEKLFMVTDAVTPAGTDMTEYDMAGIKAYVTDGKCHYQDGTIAGAAITMIQGVRNLIEHVGLSREEALRMASLYPAKALNIDNRYGRIKAGYKANITLLTPENDIHSVYQMGKRYNSFSSEEKQETKLEIA